MNLYLFFGYVVFWSLIFGYVLYLHRSQVRINQDLTKLTADRQGD